MRSGKWKLHWNNGKLTQLYNLEADIEETENVITREPAAVQRLTALLKEFEKEIAENSRPAAFVKNPTPLKK